MRSEGSHRRPTATSRVTHWSRRLFGTSETMFVALILLVAVVGFGVFAEGFLSGPSVATIVRTAAFTGIVAVGMTVLLVTGQFDISVGSVAGLSAVSAAMAMQSADSVLVGVLVGVAVGITVGLLNGVLTTVVGIPAFIVTLGTLFAARGLAYVLSKGRQVYPLPPGVKVLSNDVAGIPVSVITLIAVAVVGEWLLRRSGYGRRAYAVGGNDQAASLSGISPVRIRLVAFVFSGLLAGIAGILIMSLLNSGDPQIGTGLEFAVIAAVVVGGVGLTGGVGTVVGGLVGVLFIQVISTGLVTLGVDSSLQPAVLGVVMIAALSLKLFAST
jgi:ribose transport system permease protein